MKLNTKIKLWNCQIKTKDESEGLHPTKGTYWLAYMNEKIF